MSGCRRCTAAARLASWSRPCTAVPSWARTQLLAAMKGNVTATYQLLTALLQQLRGGLQTIPR